MPSGVRTFAEVTFGLLEFQSQAVGKHCVCTVLACPADSPTNVAKTILPGGQDFSEFPHWQVATRRPCIDRQT